MFPKLSYLGLGSEFLGFTQILQLDSFFPLVESRIEAIIRGGYISITRGQNSKGFFAK